MTDETFFERLREEAKPLRLEVDDVSMGRVAARIRARIAEPPTPAHYLVRWFRPAAVSFAAVAVAATLAIAWIDLQSEPAVEELTAVNAVEISVAGDIYSVRE